MSDMKMFCAQCQTTFVNNSAFPCAQCGAMSFGELMPIPNREMEDAPWNSPEFEEGQRKQRRAEWIRENVTTVLAGLGATRGWTAPHIVMDEVEQLADELVKRGYL